MNDANLAIGQFDNIRIAGLLAVLMGLDELSFKNARILTRLIKRALFAVGQVGDTS